jgi:peptide deformylase
MVDMIYKLLPKDHPFVHTEMPEYVDSDEISRKDLLENMIETMKHYGGIGLSANQVGLPYRMFVFGDKENYIPCFNPKITVESENFIPIEEGCLTYPGLFVKIRRPDWIEVEFEDENGEKHSDTFEGLMCRVFQHEMDHMNGIDFTSRAKKMDLNIAKRKLKRGKLKLKRAHGKDMLARAS